MLDVRGTLLCALAMILVPAVTAPGASVAQSAIDADGVLGLWHSDGVGQCPTDKESAKPRMNPVTFVFTGVNADGSFEGNWMIYCHGGAGAFDRRKHVARLHGSSVVVELKIGGRTRKYTYAFTPSGDTASGEMMTPWGDHVATTFQRTQ